MPVVLHERRLLASGILAVSIISAASYSAFQIPNNPSQVALGDFGSPTANSATLNENEYDTYVANIVAWQRHGTDGDAQIAAYSRYANVHFVPDIFGDLEFNDVASNVTRESVLNGIQGDASYLVNNRHTLRFGFAVSGEQTNITDIYTVLPGSPGAVTGPPFDITDNNSKLGWNIGAYIQDEWKLTNAADAECRAAFRSIVPICRRQPVQPASGAGL